MANPNKIRLFKLFALRHIIQNILNIKAPFDSKSNNSYPPTACWLTLNRLLDKQNKVVLGNELKNGRELVAILDIIVEYNQY